MKYLKYTLSTLALVACFAFTAFSQCQSIDMGKVDIKNPQAYSFTATSSDICDIAYDLEGDATKNYRIAFVLVTDEPNGYKLAALRNETASVGPDKGEMDVELVPGRKYKILPQVLD